MKIQLFTAQVIMNMETVLSDAGKNGDMGQLMLSKH